MVSYLSIFVALGSLLDLTYPSLPSQARGVTLAFCNNTPDERWRRTISMTIQIPFRVQPIDCGDVENTVLALAIQYPDGEREIVSKTMEQSEEMFFASIVRKISGDRITRVTDSLEAPLISVEEAVVVFVKENTAEDLIVEQVMILPSLPKTIKIFKVTKISHLPSDMQRDVCKNLHVWIVTGKEWNHIRLPYNTMYKIKPCLISVLSKLKYPLKFIYETDDTYSQYIGAGFNFFTVYHHSHQQEEVHATIINPLVNIFRPFFVFISVDIDQYQLPQTIDSNTPLPLVVITRHDKRFGVPISSNDTLYTTDNFRDILESVIIKAEKKNELEEDNLFGLSFAIEKLNVPSNLLSLTTITYKEFIGQHESCLIAYILPYSLSCKTLLFHMKTSTSIMQTGGMPMAIVNCLQYPDVCEIFDINRYPTVMYRRNSDDGWVTYKGIISNGELIKLIDKSEDKQQDMIELTPSSLITIIKKDRNLTCLLILVAGSIAPELQTIMADVTKYKIYWLNSTIYTKLSRFLSGRPISHSPPPVLVMADYTKNALYRFHLKRSASTTGDIKLFLSDIATGNQAPDDNISPTEWRPITPPIKFPSLRQDRTFLRELTDSDVDSDDGDLELINKQPLYADPNRHSREFYRPGSKPHPSIVPNQSDMRHPKHEHQEL